MKKAYFTISYANKDLFKEEIKALEIIFNKYNIELLVFVNTYNFKPNEEKKMMQTAFHKIDSVDLLVAELTTKSIGVGIEIGYAFAKSKPIIYLKKKDAEYSTTAAGSAHATIEYTNKKELILAVEKLIIEIRNKTLN